MKISEFKKLPIMGIMRDITVPQLEPLISSIISSGLKTIEITMNTANAPVLIKKAIDISHNDLTIGAGTVLTMDQLHLALDSGASFIVLPTFVKEIVQYCANRRISVFPGGLTPQEVYLASLAGASMVKVFPANLFGPSYFKELKGPFKDIDLMAVGGVNKSNIRSFFECGASAIAIGNSVFNNEWLEKKEFHKIETKIKELISKFSCS